MRQGAGLSVDVLRFRELLAKVTAHSHSAYRLCDDCLNALSEAVALYRADLLAGFSLKDAPEFDAWQTYQTETLRLELGDALEKLAAGLAGARQYTAAIGHARRWLTLDPLNEAAHALLMRLYAWSGDRAAIARQYNECVRVLADQLGIEPEPGTTTLFHALTSGKTGVEGTAADRLALTAPPPLHNLTPDATPFVGRETELSQLAVCLADPACRLLTVIGPGGIGKTRLAVQGARRETERFSHGVYLVDLAPLASAESLATAILRALQVPERGSDPEQRLLGFLRDKQMLLVLDNYEHLLTGPDLDPSESYGLLNSMLTTAPDLKLLVTSRTRLNLRAEWLAPLSGLDVPPREDALATLVSETELEADHPAAADQAAAPDVALDLDSYSATALFLGCVRRLRPSFAPTVEETHHIARICRLLEGVPLAIELAASRTRTLALAEIADELQRDLRLLTTTMRDVPLRHRSMFAVFEYSWSLLAPRSRSILRQIAVFRGGFSAEAASAVSGATLADLDALTDASWVRVTSPGRYALHELIRQYCADKLISEHLAGTGEHPDLVRDRHAAYIHANVLTQFHKELRGQGGWVEMAYDMDNMMAVWDWLWQRGDLATIRSLSLGMHFRADRLGWYQTMTQLFAAAQLSLDKLAHSRVDTVENRHEIILTRATFLTCQSEIASRLGLSQQADAYVMQAAAMMDADEIKDDQSKGVRWVLRRMTAWHMQFRGDFIGSAALFRELLPELEQDRFPIFPYAVDAHLAWLGEAAYGQGYNALALGQYDEARRLAEWSMATFHSLDNAYMPLYSARVLVLVLIYTGEFTEAQRVALSSLKLAQAYEDRYAMAHWLVILGRLYTAWGKYDRARVYLRRNLILTRKLGLKPWLANTLSILGNIELALGNMAGAKLHYTESLALYPGAQRAFSPALAANLNGLGRVALAASDLLTAGSHFRQALTAPLRMPEDTAVAIAALAQAAQQAGEIERVGRVACICRELACHAAHGQGVGGGNTARNRGAVAAGCSRRRHGTRAGASLRRCRCRACR